MKLLTVDRPFLSVNEVCKILGQVRRRNGKIVYLRHVVDDAIRTGRLKAYRLSAGKRKSKFIVHPDDLRKFLDTCEYKAGGSELRGVVGADRRGRG